MLFGCWYVLEVDVWLWRAQKERGTQLCVFFASRSVISPLRSTTTIYCMRIYPVQLLADGFFLPLSLLLSRALCCVSYPIRPALGGTESWSGVRTGRVPHPCCPLCRPCPPAHQDHDEEGGVGPPGSSPGGRHQELHQLRLKRVHPEVPSHVHGDAEEEEELRIQLVPGRSSHPLKSLQ